MVCIGLGGGISLCVDNNDHLVVKQWDQSQGKEVQITDLGLATEHRFKLIESTINTLSFHAVGG